jgi:tRNA(Ser,Leu) C12 N-acetylase TAN1
MEILMTAYQDKAKELIKELAGLGIFWETEFADVVRGQIDDYKRFVESLNERGPFCLSRLAPIKCSFCLTSNNVVEDLKGDAYTLAQEIGEGETFCVKVNRRGLRGAYSSREVAAKIGTYVSNLLKEKYGTRPIADLENPDKALVFETLGDWCGVYSISKRMRKKCRYLRLP